MTELIIAQMKAVKKVDRTTGPDLDESPEDIIREMRECAAFNEQRFDKFPPEYQCWFNGEIVVSRRSVADRLFGFAGRLERAIARMDWHKVKMERERK